MRTGTYIVASTPRSGSTLLCEGLEATGVAGRPAEVFAPAFEEMWRDYWSMPPDGPFGDFVRAALIYGTTPNGIYGLKIHWEHVPVLARRLGVRGDPGQVLSAMFPGAAFVNIVRDDRRGQALSLFRAMATDEWARFDGGPPPRTQIDTVSLDRSTVRMLETAIDAQQAGWIGYFTSYGIVPLTVRYEHLDRDYRGEIARVLAFLGADATIAATIPEPRLARQSDAVNLRWRRTMEDAETGGRP